MTTWREDLGIWWPAFDTAAAVHHAWVMRSVGDSAVALKYCRQRRACIQAGGHVGLWPIRLAASFGRVYTFEADTRLQPSLIANTRAHGNIIVSAEALGASIGLAPFNTARKLGVARLEEGGHIAHVTTIDALELGDCDLIYLDIEGGEVAALQGAAETIARCKPVIAVEMLVRTKVEIHAHMLSIGYTARKRLRGDMVYVPTQ